MPKPELMTEAEIHDFGVEIVVGYLQKEGYVIERINPKLGHNPQIVARKGDLYKFVAVRTACYPNKGEIKTEAEFLSILEIARKHKATPYFAAVGIANADSTNAEECGTPVKGAPYHILFNGLLIMATMDKVRVLSTSERINDDAVKLKTFSDTVLEKFRALPKEKWRNAFLNDFPDEHIRILVYENIKISGHQNICIFKTQYTGFGFLSKSSNLFVVGKFIAH